MAAVVQGERARRAEGEMPAGPMGPGIVLGLGIGLVASLSVAGVLVALGLPLGLAALFGGTTAVVLLRAHAG